MPERDAAHPQAPLALPEPMAPKDRDQEEHLLVLTVRMMAAGLLEGRAPAARSAAEAVRQGQKKGVNSHGFHGCVRRASLALD